MSRVMPAQMPVSLHLDEDEPRQQYSGRMRFVTSVSQIKMFSPSAKGCPRRWAMHYLWGFPREQTPALRDGIRLHKSIGERWAVDAAGDAAWSAKWDQDPKTRALALALMRRVPDRSAWISEPTYFLEVEELDTAIFIKPDLLSGEPERFPHDPPKGFKDWKSTSALHKRSPWVLQDPKWWTGGQLPVCEVEADKLFSLQNDIQFRLYSHGLMTLFGGSEIEGEWVYGCKKFDVADGQPKTWSLTATAQRAETRDWCETYVWPVIRTMNALRAWHAEKQLDSALLVPHNPFSCNFQGKFCDVLGHCAFKRSPIGLEKLHLPVIPA
jgi:hypothetical protein